MDIEHPPMDVILGFNHTEPIKMRRPICTFMLLAFFVKVETQVEIAETLFTLMA